MDSRGDHTPGSESEPRIADAKRPLRDAPQPIQLAADGRGADGEPIGHYELQEPPGPAAPRPFTPAPAVGDGSIPLGTIARPPSWSPPPAPPPVEPSEAVEQIWSRRAEWGGTILFLASVAAAFLFGFYTLITQEEFGLAFLWIMAGGLVLVVLSYPILITLEVPVRVTPEQAANDFFGALSHHLPHYRRMWLLLSRAGRAGEAFGSYEGFRRYWKRRLAELRAGHAFALTPLKFQVEDFRSSGSKGKVTVDVNFTLRVYVRGRQQEGPIESFKVRVTLVRGPDRMWYLDRGTLP